MAWVPRCTPYRRPEKRRPPYTRAVCRVVNAPRWPPGGASVPTVSAAGTTPTALPPRRPCRADNATRCPPEAISVLPHRRPEQRRPPYPRAVCRVVNAPRWPPGGASVPTVSGAGTTPTALPPRHPCRVVNAPRWPPGGASVPTVSAAGTTPTALRPRHPCRVVNAPRWPRGGGAVPTVSAAGTTPTALRPRRPCRVVNATRWPPGRTSVHTVSAGRKRCPPYARAALVGWATPRVRPPYQPASGCSRLGQRLALAPFHEGLEEQGEQRHAGEQGGRGEGGGGLVVVVQLLDQQRQRQGLVHDGAGHHGHRAELAHRPGVGDHHPVQQRPLDVGQGDVPEDLPAISTQGQGGGFLLGPLALHGGNQDARHIGRG